MIADTDRSAGAARSEPAVHGSPRLPSWIVSRPRLVEKLDARAPLTVVRAPAGGGKTILLAEWVRASTDPSLRGIWLDVGAHPLSRTGFWGEVVAGLVDAGLVGAGQVFHAGVAALREVGDIRSFLTRGLSQLGEITLVIDGADHLDEHAAADLTHVVAAVPSVRAVVASRSASWFESTQVRLLLDVVVLTGDALALTTGETAHVLGASPERAEQVHRATGGSPLATRIVVLERESPATVDPHEALETLVLSVLATVDPTVVEFVRTTAVADVVSSDLAGTLTGVARPTAMLDEVERLGLGTWSGTGERKVFRYTTVVRLALRTELQRSAPDRFRELRRHVATWSDEHGRPVEALEAAVDAQDLGLAADVVRHHWRGFLSEHAGTVRRTVAPSGLLRLRHHPVLIFFIALGYNADRRGRVQAVALFGLAIAAARVNRRRVPVTERLVLRVIEMIALRLTGRAHAAANAADDLIRWLDELTAEQYAEIADLVPQICAHSGIALLYDGRPDDAVGTFERGLAEATIDFAALPNLALLAGTHAMIGSVPRAAAIVAEARLREWPDGWVDGYSGAFYQVAEALLALEDLDAPRAQRHIDRLERHLETIEHWPVIAHVQACIDLLVAGADTALERLGDTRRFHGRRQSTHRATDVALDALTAMLLVAAGRPLAALDSLSGAPRSPATAVSLARAQLVAGQPEKALGTLTQATGPRVTVRVQCSHALLEAAALDATAHDSQAASALRRADALLTVHRLRTPLLILTTGERARLHAVAERHGLVAAAEMLSAPLPDVIPEQDDVPALTPREHVILRELARTGSITEIADALVVSTHTVKSQLQTLYRKLAVTSRVSAIAAARQHGLLEGGPPGRPGQSSDQRAQDAPRHERDGAGGDEPGSTSSATAL